MVAFLENVDTDGLTSYSLDSELSSLVTALFEELVCESLFSVGIMRGSRSPNDSNKLGPLER